MTLTLVPKKSSYPMEYTSELELLDTHKRPCKRDFIERWTNRAKTQELPPNVMKALLVTIQKLWPKDFCRQTSNRQTGRLKIICPYLSFQRHRKKTRGLLVFSVFSFSLTFLSSLILSDPKSTLTKF